MRHLKHQLIHHLVQQQVYHQSGELNNSILLCTFLFHQSCVIKCSNRSTVQSTNESINHSIVQSMWAKNFPIDVHVSFTYMSLFPLLVLQHLALPFGCALTCITRHMVSSPSSPMLPGIITIFLFLVVSSSCALPNVITLVSPATWCPHPLHTCLLFFFWCSNSWFFCLDVDGSSDQLTSPCIF